jgi:predicted GNAT family acetyltransferase
MTINLDAYNVSHNKAEQRFELEIDGHTALLSYHLPAGTISLDHTFVPPPIEGQGVAAKMTRAALDFARAEGLRAVPACSYVAAYVREHPEYQDLVAR